jgi:hypothetical protein
MRILVKDWGELELDRGDFVAQGGEARVFAKDGTAYKLYHDVARVLPAGKMAELAAIADPRVVKPERLVLEPSSGRPLGYAMRYLADCYPLCQLFPRSFRERNGLDPVAAFALVRRLRSLLDAVHRAGVLVVDLNELNVLVDRALHETFAIDADSYQTAHYPATALTPSVRDPLAPLGQWSEQSDWFSFAVLTFQLLVGIHPYKGNHPSVSGLEARMAQHLSVFDPAVRIPKVCYPLEVIPEPFRSWYRAVLHQAERSAPPSGEGAIAFVAPVCQPVAPGGALSVREVGRYDGTILGVWESHGALLVHTDRGLWLDGRPLRLAPLGRLAVGFSPRMNRPVAAWLDGALRVRDLGSGHELCVGVRPNELGCHDGRILLRAADKILELELTDVGPTVIASTRIVANVLANATRLYDGVAMQSVLGASYALLFPQAGSCHAVRVPELDQLKVVEAKLDGHVLMVLTTHGARYDRLVLRFDCRFERYDLRRIDDVAPTGLDFVTLDSGVCVCLDEQDRLELFSASMGSSAVRWVHDESLGADMRLVRHAGGVAFFRGELLYRMSLR